MGEVFRLIKEKLTARLVLYTSYYNVEFILQTDASEKGLNVENNEEYNKRKTMKNTQFCISAENT